MAIIFAIMSFFYKYVDLSGQDEDPPEGKAPFADQDESSALIGENGNGANEQTHQLHTSTQRYVTESEGESVFDKDGKYEDATRSESEF